MNENGNETWQKESMPLVGPISEDNTQEEHKEVGSIAVSSSEKSGIDTEPGGGAGGGSLRALGGAGGRGSNGQGNSGTGIGIGSVGSGGSPGFLFVRANYAQNPKPEYPERARREGWEGTVLLRVLVNPQGKPDRVDVSRSSGFESLDRAAIETVKGWRFHPARYGERQVESWIQVPIVFTLEGNRQ